MVSLGASSFGTPVSIAEGIETMQVEYGVDDGTNGGTADDGVPDQWQTDPGKAASTGLSGAAADLAAATAWKRVVAVKLRVLARNTQASSGQFTDTRAYVLGSTTSTDNTFGPYNDSYKRHVYTTVSRLMNPAGRLEQQ
jgi:type IV pilus assembly protein PilW